MYLYDEKFQTVFENPNLKGVIVLLHLRLHLVSLPDQRFEAVHVRL